MTKTNLLVQIITRENHCWGRTSLGNLINDLVNEYAKVEIMLYKEIITVKSNQTFMSKTQNKHNRLYFVAGPYGSELRWVIEDGQTKADDDIKKISRVVQDDFGWDQHNSKKIWCFGP